MVGESPGNLGDAADLDEVSSDINVCIHVIILHAALPMSNCSPRTIGELGLLKVCC